jgi:D-alanine-D-alanine ligase
LALLFGGISEEHAVSLRSASAVLRALDQNRWDVRLVGITSEGRFLNEEDSAALLEGRDFKGPGGFPALPEGTECVFPVLHGPGGEDGSLQGWLELCGVPFVGSGTLGSALAMDKSVAKRVLRDAGIEVVSWTELRHRDYLADKEIVLSHLIEDRGLPCFVKPACQGSSVGISRVETEDELRAGLDHAFTFGEWVLVEPALNAKELEIAVLGGAEPFATVPGEVQPESWYDFSSKYENDSAELVVPAEGIQPQMTVGMQEIALRAFDVLRLSGMARIDFFIGKKTGRLVVNEVNTIPGFTSISMYPKLMEHSGIGFTDLCDRLIKEALSEKVTHEVESPSQLQAENGTA